jgi:hypothetical protein
MSWHTLQPHFMSRDVCPGALPRFPPTQHRSSAANTNHQNTLSTDIFRTAQSYEVQPDVGIGGVTSVSSHEGECHSTRRISGKGCNPSFRRCYRFCRCGWKLAGEETTLQLRDDGQMLVLTLGCRVEWSRDVKTMGVAGVSTETWRRLTTGLWSRGKSAKWMRAVVRSRRVSLCCVRIC